MTAQLTIIGLGQIGASAGMALAKHSDKITRFGHDREPKVARRAQELGAVDKIFHNLPASVENSDIVLLTLPFDQILDTLKVIAPCLKENAVVLDTSPVKTPIAGWMKENLPENCYYVGLTPAINPLYLNEQGRGVEAAHADLFANGVVGVAAPQGTVGEAVKLGADLASFLGAVPFFIDLAEADGMMAALHLLPQISATALMDMLSTRPGWGDTRKIAGRLFAGATLPVEYGDEGGALVEAVLQNQEYVLPVLDEMIAKLMELRARITAQERKELDAWVEGARNGRSKWEAERRSGDWQAIDQRMAKIPKIGIGKRLFGDLGKLFGPPKPPSKEDEK